MKPQSRYHYSLINYSISLWTRMPFSQRLTSHLPIEIQTQFDIGMTLTLAPIDTQTCPRYYYDISKMKFLHQFIQKLQPEQTHRQTGTHTDTTKTLLLLQMWEVIMYIWPLFHVWHDGSFQLYVNCADCYKLCVQLCFLSMVMAVSISY